MIEKAGFFLHILKKSYFHNTQFKFKVEMLKIFNLKNYGMILQFSKSMALILAFPTIFGSQKFLRYNHFSRRNIFLNFELNAMIQFCTIRIVNQKY